MFITIFDSYSRFDIYFKLTLPCSKLNENKYPNIQKGWNKEKQCVELQLLINEEIYVMPVYEKDVKGMGYFFWLKKHSLIK